MWSGYYSKMSKVQFFYVNSYVKHNNILILGTFKESSVYYQYLGNMTNDLDI